MNQKERAGNAEKLKSISNCFYSYFEQVLSKDPKILMLSIVRALYYNKAASMTAKLNEFEQWTSSAGTKNTTLLRRK
ncbi:MAG: hypothetical protein IPN72_10800 [Saprospiraceae bacterium]|nr:hypothetical protein [Saprospiraceae bacterium]